MNQLNALNLVASLLISIVVGFSASDSAPRSRSPSVEDATEHSHPPRKLRRWIPTDELWVELVPGRSLGDISFLVQELDLEPLETLDFDEFQIHWFRDRNGRINRTHSIDDLLAHRDLVAAAGPNAPVEPDDHLKYPTDGAFKSGKQWGLLNAGQVVDKDVGTVGADVNAPQAWQLITSCKKKNQVIGIIDTGVDDNHNELKGSVIDKKNFMNTPPTNDAPDQFDHGTGVASIIGANADGTGMVGVCWEAQFMALKIIGTQHIFKEAANGLRRMQEALKYVIDQKKKGVNVQLVNVSVGVYVTMLGPDDAKRQANVGELKKVIDQVEKQDVLLIVSSGNDAEDVDKPARPGVERSGPRVPCTLPNANIVCVGSSTHRDAVAKHSNVGAASVHLFAPGERILVAEAGTRADLETADGTSVATPYVTGIVALCKALLEDGGVRTTATGLKQLLLTDGIDRKDAFIGKSLAGGRVRWPCTVELGDAPHANFKTLRFDHGADHLDLSKEWLGKGASAEYEADRDGKLDPDGRPNLDPVDTDAFDDGIDLSDVVRPAKVDRDVTVCSDYFGVKDAEGGRYQGAADRQLYLNIWLDKNQDLSFTDPDERVVEKVIPTPPNAGAPPAALPPARTCVKVRVTFDVPEGPKPDAVMWLRMRLDYGEDAGSNNPTLFKRYNSGPVKQTNRGSVGLANKNPAEVAIFGEVEDYQIPARRPPSTPTPTPSPTSTPTPSPTGTPTPTPTSTRTPAPTSATRPVG